MFTGKGLAWDVYVQIGQSRTVFRGRLETGSEMGGGCNKESDVQSKLPTSNYRTLQ